MDYTNSYNKFNETSVNWKQSHFASPIVATKLQPTYLDTI